MVSALGGARGKKGASEVIAVLGLTVLAVALVGVLALYFSGAQGPRGSVPRVVSLELDRAPDTGAVYGRVGLSLPRACSPGSVSISLNIGGTEYPVAAFPPIVSSWGALDVLWIPFLDAASTVIPAPSSEVVVKVRVLCGGVENTLVYKGVVR